MASPTPRAPSFSRRPLRRYPSAIRTGCAKERPSGSEEGVVSNHDPYSDRQSRVNSWRNPDDEGQFVLAVVSRDFPTSSGRKVDTRYDKLIVLRPASIPVSVGLKW